MPTGHLNNSSMWKSWTSTVNNTVAQVFTSVSKPQLVQQGGDLRSGCCWALVPASRSLCFLVRGKYGKSLGVFLSFVFLSCRLFLFRGFFFTELAFIPQFTKVMSGLVHTTISIKVIFVLFIHHPTVTTLPYGHGWLKFKEAGFM